MQKLPNKAQGLSQSQKELIALATSHVQVHSIFKGLQHGKLNNKGKNKEKSTRMARE